MLTSNTKKGQVIKGAFWSAIERFSVQIVQFVVAIILSRILTPSDFAIVAIAMVFNVIFQTINESGFSLALIYKQDRDQKDFSTVFFANIVISLISYVLIYFFSYPISNFYHIPQLEIVMKLLGLNLVISSFGIVQIAKFTINVDFKRQAKASFLAALISGSVGIVYAYTYKNVYAIVVQSVLYQLINVICLWIFAKWKPSFVYSHERLIILFKYAYKLTLARLVSLIFDDIYTLFIGKLFPVYILGCYNRAISFGQISSKNIINIIQRVSVPVLCSEQDDLVRMRYVLLKFMTTAAMIVYPILAGLMLLSTPITIILLTDKWINVSEILLYVSPIGFFYLISTFNRNIYNAVGRTDIALKMEIIKKIIFVVIFVVAIQFDFHIVLISQIIISIFEMIVDTYKINQLIGLSLFVQFKALFKIIVSTIVMSIVVYAILVFVDNLYLKVLIGVFVGFCVYLYMCLILKILDYSLIKKYISK